MEFTEEDLLGFEEWQAKQNAAKEDPDDSGLTEEELLGFDNWQQRRDEALASGMPAPFSADPEYSLYDAAKKDVRGMLQGVADFATAPIESTKTMARGIGALGSSALGHFGEGVGIENTEQDKAVWEAANRGLYDAVGTPENAWETLKENPIEAPLSLVGGIGALPKLGKAGSLANKAIDLANAVDIPGQMFNQSIKGIGKGVQAVGNSGGGWAPTKLMESALKLEAPNASKYDVFDTKDKMIQDVFELDIPVTGDRGIRDMATDLQGRGKAIENVIEEADQGMINTSKKEIMELGEVERVIDDFSSGSKQWNARGSGAQARKTADQFYPDYSKHIDTGTQQFAPDIEMGVADAFDLKKNLRKELGWSPLDRGKIPDVEVKEAGIRGITKSLNNSVDGLEEMNKEFNRRGNLFTSLQESILRTGREDLVHPGDAMRPAVGGMVGGIPGMLLGSGVTAFSKRGVRGVLARALDKRTNTGFLDKMMKPRAITSPMVREMISIEGRKYREEKERKDRINARKF